MRQQVLTQNGTSQSLLYQGISDLISIFLNNLYKICDVTSNFLKIEELFVKTFCPESR